MHRLMDDFEEQIEAKYLLLKFCMKYTIMIYALHLTHCPQQGFRYDACLGQRIRI